MMVLLQECVAYMNSPRMLLAADSNLFSQKKKKKAIFLPIFLLLLLFLQQNWNVYRKKKKKTPQFAFVEQFPVPSIWFSSASGMLMAQSCRMKSPLL